MKNTKCRGCNSQKLIKILDLGKMPLANSYLRKSDLVKKENKYILKVYFCQDCGLVQLLDVISPKILFKNYAYLTSINKLLVEHFLGLGKRLVSKFSMSKKDLVVEIGSNDGILLEGIKNQVRVLGVEPAENIIPLSEKRGVETICDFFGMSLSKKILKDFGTAKLIIANNVVAHINDLDDLLKGVELLLEKDGVFVFEVHWAGNFLSGGGWDQFYHEHLSYFSLNSLLKIFEKRSLKIFDAQLVPIHGQSLCVYVGNKERKKSKSIERILKKEKELNLDKIETWKNLAMDIVGHRKEIRDFLFNLKKQGNKIVGYGAPAKGNIFLNFYGIGNEVLDYIIDDCSLKQNLFTPGTHIPILSSEELQKNFPDFILLLAWNYRDNILKKEKDFRKKGGKFIVFFPKLEII